MPETLAQLCQVDEKTFWPWRTWADFARLADKKNISVIVPIVGFADWGLGHALDAEETVLMRVLAAASRLSDPTRLLVLPPLRFVIGANPGCAFTVDVPTAHAFIDEVCATIAAAGFRRVVLFNASPWNEELIDAAARDIRIERELQMFCINLSALDLDFHPTRSRNRHALQTLITALTGEEPTFSNHENPASKTSAPLSDEDVTPLAEPALRLAEATGTGSQLLAKSSARLAALFVEISSRPALPRDGALLTMSAS
jgi:creatinine amidohydrolase